MAKRILLVVRDRERAALTSAVLAAGRLARDTGGALRIMYASPLPPPRVDRHDRVVADTDREMARIAEVGTACVDRLAAELPDLSVERVVRFGRLSDEVRAEAEVFGADLVALAAPLRPRLAHRALVWYIEHVTLGSAMPVILLPVAAPGAARRSRDAIAVPAR
jgi:nucleotide-binding universal stress UspA family protein